LPVVVISHIKMSKITLIRHGQASFGAENYDLLSDLGRLQALAVGEYFKQCSFGFDQIIHGDMQRQSETAKIIANTVLHSSSLLQQSGANEFDSDSLIKYYLPKLIDSVSVDEQVIFREGNWFKTEDSFQKVFRALITMWQSDMNCPFESWFEFRKRVLNFLNKLKSRLHTDERVAIVTSGGLISVVMQSILGLEDSQFVDLNLIINNASLSEIKIYDPDISKVSRGSLNAQLLSFNNISPLQIKNQKHYITRK